MHASGECQWGVSIAQPQQRPTDTHSRSRRAVHSRWGTVAAGLKWAQPDRADASPFLPATDAAALAHIVATAFGLLRVALERGGVESFAIDWHSASPRCPHVQFLSASPCSSGARRRGHSGGCIRWMLIGQALCWRFPLPLLLVTCMPTTSLTRGQHHTHALTLSSEHTCSFNCGHLDTTVLRSPIREQRQSCNVCRGCCALCSPLFG